MATVKIPPVLRPSVGGEKEVQAAGERRRRGPALARRAAPRHPVPALLGRGTAQPLRQRVPQRRGRPRPRRAGHDRVGGRHARDPAGHGRRLKSTRGNQPGDRAYVARMRPLLLTAAIALLLATPVAASAADFKNGDVSRRHQHRHVQRLWQRRDAARDRSIRRLAAGRGGRLRVRPQRRPLHDRLRAPHSSSASCGPAPHTKLAPVATGNLPESVSFARDGNFYVGHQRNPSSLRKFSGAGTPIQQFSPARPAALIDLSADQRTVFYTDRTNPTPPVVHRFDVATGADLADFADLGGTSASPMSSCCRRATAAAARSSRRPQRSSA